MEQINAIRMCTDTSARLLAHELCSKVLSGNLIKENLAGWSWCILNEYHVTLFVHVKYAKLYDEFIIDTDLIHVQSKLLMNKFDKLNISKRINDVWKQHNQRLSVPTNVIRLSYNKDTITQSTGCAKYIGLLEYDQTSDTIIGSPAIWLLANVISVAQISLGLNNAAVQIQSGGLVMITGPEEFIDNTNESNYMPLVHIVSGLQTNEFWASLSLTGSMVLTEYNNCIIG